MINRDKQNVKFKFDLPLAIILSLMIFDGKLGFYVRRECAGRVGVRQAPGIRFQEGSAENETGYR